MCCLSCLFKYPVQQTNGRNHRLLFYVKSNHIFFPVQLNVPNSKVSSFQISQVTSLDFYMTFSTLTVLSQKPSLLPVRLPPRCPVRNSSSHHIKIGNVSAPIVITKPLEAKLLDLRWILACFSFSLYLPTSPSPKGRTHAELSVLIFVPHPPPSPPGPRLHRAFPSPWQIEKLNVIYGKCDDGVSEGSKNNGTAFGRKRARGSPALVYESRFLSYIQRYSLACEKL